ncbi:hypothetical protein ACHIPZ_29330 [Antrihabitans sp. NCIMB 15449]|uniref:Uncharacterized protein n=1 Tax=Antrihabitans spumae TaxID=3373370 RepID=A0ABW7JW85_9NOCA
MYNREILAKVLPDLVSRSIPELVDTDDPGSILELLPGRGKEARSWADDIINEPIMRGVAAVPCLPDLDGVLRRPEKIKVQPAFLSEFNTWISRWAAVEGRPSNWLHESVDRSVERRSKADRLVAFAHTKPQGVGEWLRDLAVSAGVEGSREAIRFAALIEKDANEQAVEVRKTAFVLTADGNLRAPHGGRLFLPESADERGPDFVHPSVVADSNVVDSLGLLGIHRLDQMGRLRAQIARMGKGPVGGQLLEQLWELTREVPISDAHALLVASFGEGGAPVLTLAGRSEAVGQVLLPGVIVPADGHRDGEVAIDTGFHAQDVMLLRMLGAASEPQLDRPGKDESWFHEWEKAAKVAYTDWAAGRGHRVHAVKIVAGRTFRGLDVAERLSDRGRSALTAIVLSGGATPWTIDSTSGRCESMRFTNPAVWWMSRHGVVDTAFGLQPVRNAFASVDGIPDELLPVARVAPEHAAALGLDNQVRNRDWLRILTRPWDSLDPEQLNRLYSLAAEEGAPAPAEIGVVLGAKNTLVAPSRAYATVSPAVYQILSDGGYPAVLAPHDDQMSALIDCWGLQDALGIVNRTVLAAVSGDATPLNDKFPGLRAFIKPVPDVELIPCSDLSVEVTTESASGPDHTEYSILRDGDRTIYFRDGVETLSG